MASSTGNVTDWSQNLPLFLEQSHLHNLEFTSKQSVHPLAASFLICFHGFHHFQILQNISIKWNHKLPPLLESNCNIVAICGCLSANGPADNFERGIGGIWTPSLSFSKRDFQISITVQILDCIQIQSIAVIIASMVFYFWNFSVGILSRPNVMARMCCYYHITCIFYHASQYNCCYTVEILLWFETRIIQSYKSQ